MYRLYSLPGSCSTGINILLRELELNFEIINPTDIENYKEVSPTGQVPALDDHGLIITEGAAIVLYLMEKHKFDWRKTELFDKAEFLRWLMFNYATLHPAYSKVFTVNSIMTEGPVKDATLQTLADGVSNNWTIIEKRLEGREYMVGDSFTVIDYLLAIYASWNNYFPEQEIALGDNTAQLIERVSRLEVFKKSYEHEGIEYSFNI